ncbi:hypothetical protein H4582DRAFT_1992404 [Lactarius indigo]|nr:hypothetical protein H4582DRAFT_1992404 [Lactarius indigo]
MRCNNTLVVVAIVATVKWSDRKCSKPPRKDKPRSDPRATSTPLCRWKFVALRYSRGYEPWFIPDAAYRTHILLHATLMPPPAATMPPIPPPPPVMPTGPIPRRTPPTHPHNPSANSCRRHLPHCDDAPSMPNRPVPIPLVYHRTMNGGVHSGHHAPVASSTSHQRRCCSWT